MRRFLASLLVALFSFALISPAVAAGDANSRLPACCRKMGKHRCGTMESETQSASTSAIRTGRCSSFPTFAAAPANPFSTFPPASIQAANTPPVLPAIAHATNLVYESTHDAATPKRGPPVRL